MFDGDRPPIDACARFLAERETSHDGLDERSFGVMQERPCRALPGDGWSLRPITSSMPLGSRVREAI
jgi:hypothetical protein